MTCDADGPGAAVGTEPATGVLGSEGWKEPGDPGSPRRPGGGRLSGPLLSPGLPAGQSLSALEFLLGFACDLVLSAALPASQSSSLLLFLKDSTLSAALQACPHANPDESSRRAILMLGCRLPAAWQTE